MSDTVRIGCSSGFWGDSQLAAPQLVHQGNIDFLVADYLAEITLSIMARMRAKSPDAGYAVDFVTAVMAPLAKEIKERGIRVVTNAGGMNPRACAEAVRQAAEKAGVSFKIAVIEGDDLLAKVDELRDEVIEMGSGKSMPEKMVSINAYLGAKPIKEALDAGAEVVITGRCTDSAVVLGPLMHSFGWAETDYDKLAQGTLAGHLVECGAQATGGLFTDWETVPDWEIIGYPIAECRADGTFTITKPADTGGLVSPATVAEQTVYEIGDPGAYLMADLVCDFTGVKLESDGLDRVRVSGSKGRPATDTYKVSGTYGDGFRSILTVMIGGIDADKKARRVGEALLRRTAAIFSQLGMPPYLETSVEVIGAEDTYGANARGPASRDVVLKIGVRHPMKEALEIFSREVTSAGTSMAPGLTGLFGGRPKVTPVVRHFPFLLGKDKVQVSYDLGDGPVVVDCTPPETEPAEAQAFSVSHETYTPSGHTTQVPLIRLAHGRSGDKGNDANIGIIARNPAYLPLLRGALTADAVERYFDHLLDGGVTRYEWPGISALNFLLHDVLGGGGMASLRYDPQGKAFAQMLLDYPIAVPTAWLETGGPLEEGR